MNSVLRFVALILVLLSCNGSAHAVGDFIPAPNRADIVHDASRNILYITNGDSVLRYSLASKSFLTPFVLGGQLKGIDISPDNNTLVVADTTRTATDIWVHLVDLGSGTNRKALLAREAGEGGTFAAAYGNDGNILISSTYEGSGSGSVPLRRYSPTFEASDVIATIKRDTMLVASGDRDIIAFAEGKDFAGNFGSYRVSDGKIVRSTTAPSASGTSAINYEVGCGNSGSTLAVVTNSGTKIYQGGTLSPLATLGSASTGLPIGVVFHPASDLAYFAWSGTGEIRVYDVMSFYSGKAPQPLYSFDFENQFDDPHTDAYTEGRLKMSKDGSLLFATVEGGVRFLNVDALVTFPAPPSPVPAPTGPTVVTNTNNSGLGSLRAAIEAANAHPGPDTVVFNIPGAGPYRIKPTSALPALIDSATTIDGSTQPGYSSQPVVILDGSRLPSAGGRDGFLIQSSSCVIKGLLIGNCSNGIQVAGSTATGNTIKGCWIGWGVPWAYISTKAFPNGVGIMIREGANSNTIGGTTDGERNIISGNWDYGILEYSSSPFFPYPNPEGKSGYNKIMGNWIGPTTSESQGLSNRVGISLSSGHNVIGKDQDGSGRGNVIAFNDGGLLVEIWDSRSNPSAVNNVISANRIHSNTNGVELQSAGSIVSDNSIDSNTDTGLRIRGDGTIFQANGGVTSVVNSTVTGNVIRSNKSGLFIDGSNNVIGRGLTGNGNPNRITNNETGVSVSGGEKNVIRGNAIFLNTGSGIRFGAVSSTPTPIVAVNGSPTVVPGSTPNDLLDSDSGPNTLQNHPYLTEATRTGVNVTLKGLLLSKPNTNYTIDFYRNNGVNNPATPQYEEGEIHSVWVDTPQLAAAFVCGC